MQSHFSSFALLSALLFLPACTKKTAVVEPLAHSQAETHHAELLQLQEFEEGRMLCRILNPWRTNEVVAQYLLVPQSDTRWTAELKQQYEETFGSTTLLRTPLQHMTLTSACHAWLLHALDAIDRVAVMCDTTYVSSSDVKHWLRTHPVQDGGSSTMPNREIIVQSGSDALWISPFESTAASTYSDLPVPLIYCADYMENSPLGRAEWMKFYGRLVGKAAEADSLFTVVAASYDSLSALQATTTLHPKLLAELPYGPTWYVPGGRSTSSQLYQDAGFRYPWTDDTHAGSLSLSPEAVLIQAQDCDVWYFKYMDSQGDWTRADFLQQNPYYPQFKAAQEGQLWGCNTSHSDFFDVTPFRPDWLLESIIHQDERYFKHVQ